MKKFNNLRAWFSFAMDHKIVVFFFFSGSAKTSQKIQTVFYPHLQISIFNRVYAKESA